MMKRTMLAAFAVTASVSAFGQSDMMMVPDAKAAKPKELMAFINKDAYKKLPAPTAYRLTEFLGGLPGNYQTALLRGLVLNAQEAKTATDRNQAAANGMAPMGDTMMDMKSMMQPGDPVEPKSYDTAIRILEHSQDETDRGLIDTLFAPKPFTVDQLMTPYHEAELDAITKYLIANAKSEEPIRLKYTSLAPRNYPGLPADWASKPWPAGS